MKKIFPEVKENISYPKRWPATKSDCLCYEPKNHSSNVRKLKVYSHDAKANARAILLWE